MNVWTMRKMLRKTGKTVHVANAVRNAEVANFAAWHADFLV